MLSCLSCLSVILVYCGQTVRWIKMKLRMQVGLGRGHSMGTQFPRRPPIFRSSPTDDLVDSVGRYYDTSAFCCVASWQQSEKVEHGYTTTNLTLSNDIKIVSVFPRLHGEFGHSNSDVESLDRQSHRQKTQRFWPPRRRVKSEP